MSSIGHSLRKRRVAGTVLVFWRLRFSERGRMKQAFAIQALMICVARSVFAGDNGPGIFIDPPVPDNGKKPITYQCPGQPCVENCIFPSTK